MSVDTTAISETSRRPVAASGTFRLGGELAVHRLGFGAMRLTGPGIWGPPADRATAVAVLRRAVELGVTLIDTADSYGPAVSEDLIREALHLYPSDLVIATKGGLLRTGLDQWPPCGRPDYLRQCVEMSLRRLGVEAIDLYQLHRIDPQVPAAAQPGPRRTSSVRSATSRTRARCGSSACQRSAWRRSRQPSRPCRS